MMCESCHKRLAVSHIIRAINGHMEELHLCDECSSKYSLFGGIFSDEGINSFLAGLLGSPKKQTVQRAAPEDGLKCPLCSSTLHEIAQTGRIGCAQCYSVFRSALEPFIFKLHGSAMHTGAAPHSSHASLSRRRELARLRREQNEAVEMQDYERAAVLRDKIHELEQQDADAGKEQPPNIPGRSVPLSAPHDSAINQEPEDESDE